LFDHLPAWIKDLNEYAGLIQVLLILLGVVLGHFIIPLLRRVFRKPQPPPPDLASERCALLNNVGNQIQQWQQDNFAQKANLSLRYSGDPDRVDKHWRSVWYQAEEKELPEGAIIGNTFEQANRRLLIVGDPGTGKSNELYRLAAALHLTASKPESEQPVPILLNLTSWAEEEHENLGDWIAKQLERSYQVRADCTLYWKDRVLPLLDALDEVAPEVRDKCLKAIVAYAWQPLGEDGRGGSPSRKVAVTTRPEEYDQLNNRVEMAVARVEFLTGDQVDDLLETMTPLRRALNTDPDPTNLCSILKTPLMLALLYEGYSAEPSQDARPEDRVYGRFLDATLQHLEGGTDDARRWLGWLAASLENRSSARFDMEDLDPSWLIDSVT